ncbi:hypothetical protein V2J09_010457 [Rumex salicifolius]
MAGRGQKRSELGDEMPADKRACSSLESRPSSSNSPPQVVGSSIRTESHEKDMETSSSASASGRSEGDLERDYSPYGSCDSDDYNESDHRHRTLARFQRQRSYGDQGKIKRVISSLNDDADPSAQLASLTELCEVLSFATEDSISSMLADQLAPGLVKLAKHETNPDIMLLSIRAITYLCDVYPRASAFLVKYEILPALCQRLTAIEYLDVAEQCLQALEMISHDQPIPCMQSGAIMAVLGFIDFFSTILQRSALSTVVNICRKLPSECPAPIIEAVPRLCELLHYEDKQLVENVVTCLLKIVERVKDSPDMLNELCKHGLVKHTMHLIGSNTRTTLSQTTYSSLIGLLAKLAAGSTDAVTMIFELEIGSIIKDILSNYELSHGMLFPHAVEKQSNQTHEVLRLLNELLPPIDRHDEDQILSCKEKILADHPDELQKFGMNVLPLLIQVVNSGANLVVCYRCLSVISKLVYHTKSEMLLGMVENSTMPCFLMGVFTRKDYHIQTLALQITEMVLQKLPDASVTSFAKEGVLFAIDALLTPEKCSVFMFPSASGSSALSDYSLKRCLCYAYDTDQCVSPSEPKACRIEKDSVEEVAKRVKEKYLAADFDSMGSAITDVLQNLRKASDELTSLAKASNVKEECTKNEEKLYSMLHQMMVEISGSEPISTFELIESGIVKALVNYLFGGLYEEGNIKPSDIFTNFDLVLKRFEAFARLSLFSFDLSIRDLPLPLLVRKLQTALSTVESFPVTLGNMASLRSSYASVPSGRAVPYPSLQVRFKREEEETKLADYSEEMVTVDPFCSVEAIKLYLWPKVAKTGTDRSNPPSPAHGLLFVAPGQVASRDDAVSPGPLESDSVCATMPELQEDRDKTIQTANNSYMDVDEAKSEGEHETLIGFTTAGPQHSLKVDPRNESIRNGTSLVNQSNVEGSLSDVSSEAGNGSSRLTIHLEGAELGNSSTLYQEVLRQKMKSQDQLYSGEKLWTEVHTVIYKNAVEVSNESLYPDQPCVLLKQYLAFSPDTIVPVPVTEDSSHTNDILLLLRSLEVLNRYASRLVYHERVHMFANGKSNDLIHSELVIPKLSVKEFVNSKLSEKFKQQMRDPLTVSIGAMPSWCNCLMSSFPFLVTFEVRCKFFQLAAFGRSCAEPQSPQNDSDRRASSGGLPRKKFSVSRECILESAAQMMNQQAQKNVVVEVEYSEEVGTGLGPTLEFYTLVCHEFQKSGLGMWRADYQSSDYLKKEIDLGSGMMTPSVGLFPRPWLERADASKGIDITDVNKKFSLLGWIMAKALQDGRVLDIPFSKAFYKLILGQDLSLYDIQSFDPELGRTLLEFHAIISRQKCLRADCKEDLTSELDLSFRGMGIEDLYLDFTLPGYPDYFLADQDGHSVVTLDNLEEYVSLVVDATLNAGIYRQVEAFMSGFNKVFPITHLRIFTEEELELLLCGESDSWVSTELLDHIKFDHGYTVSSPPILYLLEIIHELNYEQRRAFLQFVTGSPRLPPGGLTALNPKLTIVRKHSSNSPDLDLPSVMTCTNYLKLPPYSCKERMKEKLLYAITEGQGSFHLS